MKKLLPSLRVLLCASSLAVAPVAAKAATQSSQATCQVAACGVADDPTGEALAQARAIVVGAVGESGYNTLVVVLGADPFEVAYIITHSAFVMTVQEIIDSLGL